MIDGKSFTPQTQSQKDLARRFTDVMIAKMFHWTFQQINELPSDFYDDLLLILSKEEAKQKIEREKEKARAGK